MFKGRIGVIGAGALGAFYGACLARAGADVHFLMRSDHEAVRQHGLRIQSILGDFDLRPPVYASARELGPCDLLLIGLKTVDNAALPELLAPTATADTIILTLQNGLGNEEAIAAALVSNRTVCDFPTASKQIIGGTAFLCSNRIAPGVIHHSAHGFIRLAEFCGRPRSRTHEIAQSFVEAGIECEVRESLASIRWEKLVWNIPFNGLGVAAHHADTRVILEDPELRALAWNLMGEVLEAARADGVSIPDELRADLMQKTESMGAYKSSMQIDYENGRPLEVEALLGEPVRRARRAGIPVPRMEMLFALVRRLDEQNRCRIRS
ncbi:MAG: 2-dehydropantoate 2-reductase [Candidatus Hydrogenedentota bacterium]|jgi:2-dehydropantoate 2-reductase|nr:2-dehydropantoate 2-reductase [Candidatus Sumerlaea chitinivorans]RMH24273.1 MAG: 2-dehydropantoate 2-reductase [Candidatus Hydrogenedentota bacterium]